MQTAATEMIRKLGAKPSATSLDQNWRGLTAQRWRHAPLHDSTEPMAEHVVMTYFGPPHRIEARFGTRTIRSSTRPGSITLIPAGHRAQWDIYGPLDVVHAYISVPRIEELARESGFASAELAPRVGCDDADAAHLLAVLNSHLDARNSANGLLAEHLSITICLHLLRSHGAGRGISDRLRGGLSPSQLKRVTDFLTNAMASPVTLQELADMVGLSRTYFCAAFKASTGMQPYAWLIAHRIARSKQLLTATKLSVAQVAEAVGYDDPAYFSRLFRKNVGASPARYRLDRGLSVHERL